MARFVLVHGAWLGSWCWDPLVVELLSRGHDVVAPDLPAEDVEAGVEHYAAAIGPEPDSIVVGHSLGGLTIPHVAARMHVWLAALVPRPGETPPFAEALDPRMTGTRYDELGRSFWPDSQTAADGLYPELDLVTREWAFVLLRRQGQRPSTDPCLLGELPQGPRASIVCTRDRAVRPEWQREAARTLLGVEPVELDSGHFPMLERPRELADALDAVSRAATPDPP